MSRNGQPLTAHGQDFTKDTYTGLRNARLKRRNRLRELKRFIGVRRISGLVPGLNGVRFTATP